MVQYLLIIYLLTTNYHYNLSYLYAYLEQFYYILCTTYHEDLLKGPDGTFLIRERPESAGDYVLGLVFHNRPTHHLIRVAHDGALELNGALYSKVYSFEQVNS